MSTPTPPGQASAPTPNTLSTLVQQLQQNALAGTSNNAGPVQNNSTIYFGFGAPATTGGDRQIAHGLPTQPSDQQPSQMTYQDARLLPLSWSQDQLKEFVNKGILYKMPGFNTNMGMPDIVSAWDDLVKASYSFNSGTSAGGQKWTPFDVMDSYTAQKGQYGTVKQGDWVVDAQTGERIKYTGPTSKTTTSKQFNLSSTGDVQALTTQVLTQALGRAPTPKEVAQYKATLNQQEARNPQVTTTTSQLTPDMATGQVSVGDQTQATTGGLSSAAEQQMVLNQAQQSQEYAKYQAGTTYFNALLQMLGGGG